MKERIVIKDEIFADFLIKNKDNHSISASPKVIMDRCIVEQVPENFAELKELVKQEVFEDFANGVKMGRFIKEEYILIDGKSFMPNGEILDEDNDVFAKNRTPQQMWQIIKSLIGEE